MYCDRHLNTELMLKSRGKETVGEVEYDAHILYCPHCGKDKYKQLTREGETIITKI